MRALTILLLSAAAMAQQATVAVHEKSRGPLTIKQYVSRPANTVILSAMAGAMAADAITTQTIIRRGGFELNPIARPFVTHGAGGQVAISGIAFGATTTAGWLLARHGHPRLARTVIMAAMAGSAYAAWHNSRECGYCAR